MLAHSRRTCEKVRQAMENHGAMIYRHGWPHKKETGLSLRMLFTRMVISRANPFIKRIKPVALRRWTMMFESKACLPSDEVDWDAHCVRL